MKNKTTIAPNIFMIENFFTKEECKKHIEFSQKNGFSEATIQTENGLIIDKSIRDNGRFSYDSYEFSEGLFERMKKYLPETFFGRKLCGLNNRVHFYKYDIGQRFNWHMDGNYSPDAYSTSYFTFMVYLNDDFKGGNTSFAHVETDDGEINFVIEPKMGTAVFFQHKVLHRGDEVTNGVKYLMRSDVMYCSGLHF